MSDYRFGQEAVMTTGRPFRLQIEGVDREFELKHRIGDDGKIYMAVDRADPVTDRRSMQDARPTVAARRHVDDDDDGKGDFDSHTGLLKDGRSLRIPMMQMRDSLKGRGTPSDPIIITTGCNLDREFYPDGTPRNRRDAETRRPRRARQADPTITQADDHRPGFRLGDGRATVDAKAAAYNEMVADLQTAWMSPEQRARNTSDTRHVTADMAPPAGVTAAEWARHLPIQEMSDAWRPRDADPLSNSTGAPTRAVPQMPLGAYPLSAGEGNQCTINGQAGHLVKEGGFLICRPDATDAEVGTRDAVNDAWNQLQEEQQNAWRTPA